ncbi:MAG: ribonuclease H-like domain-containing protein [archaeon]|nr:ribonuclease H-like domain-containing protein [archaeon]
MIKQSFVFLEKISRGKEKSIWNQGITDWHGFLKTKSIKGISKEKKLFYDRKIKEAQESLEKDNPNYFIGKLPQKEMWRLYSHFKDSSCFLDIETDSYGKIVVVGISDYYSTNHFVKGANLDTNLIEKELSKHKLIITFNGSSFDLPKLKLFGVKMNYAHIDLKPLCVNLGLIGGLKEVEKVLQLKRPEHLYGNPVDAWKAFHASGDREYLELLLDYNREDVENLNGVMNVVYERLKKVYKE